MVKARRVHRVAVRVPATSANLGPGFDCLGMALELWNTLVLETSENFLMSITGEGADSLPRNEESLIYKAMKVLCQRIHRPVPQVHVSCCNEIPLARGLGSSAAAVAGGLVAANRYYGNPLSRMELLNLGAQLEGHPDNIAPALWGGCRIVANQDGEFIQTRIPLPRNIETVLFIPQKELSTSDSRAILSPCVSRADATYNLSRVALLIAALSGSKLDLLKTATQDRLHQPARLTLFPAMEPIFQAALKSGALGVFLSGSGPTILALARENTTEIARSMGKVASELKVKGKTMVLRPSPKGSFAE